MGHHADPIAAAGAIVSLIEGISPVGVNAEPRVAREASSSELEQGLRCEEPPCDPVRGLQLSQRARLLLAEGVLPQMRRSRPPFFHGGGGEKWSTVSGQLSHQVEVVLALCGGADVR